MAFPKHVIAAFSLLLSFVASGFASETLVVGKFSSESLSNWEEKEFDGTTQYSLVDQDGVSVLKAKSDGGASGLVKEIEVNIRDYPYLNWRWKTQTSLSSLDETTKKGDDYVARVYVVKSGGFFFWKTIALNYVWSSNPASASYTSAWPNAFAGDNAQMLAIRGSGDSVGEWRNEKRNVYEDFKALFGEDIEQIDAIAIMTDTDNSKGSAIAYYGDIFFSKD